MPNLSQKKRDRMLTFLKMLKDDYSRFFEPVFCLK